MGDNMTDSIGSVNTVSPLPPMIMLIVLLPKIVLSGVNIGVIAYFCVCLGLFFGQNRLIFVPSTQIEGTPVEMGLKYEEIWLPVENSNSKTERIHAWWIPSSRPRDRVLLYLHGNGGNISNNLRRAKRYHRLGFSVLLIEYRGYGRSGGDFPSEKSVYQDAQTAWDYLVNNRQIPPQNIFIYGHSLGGAIAINLAAHQPHAGGVIVESSFTSMRHIADQNLLYRLFPINLILNQPFDSLSKLPLLRTPLLLFHGEQDSTIPVSMSQTLFDTATVPKKILLVPKADHNDVSYIGDKNYDAAVQGFVAENIKNKN
jgi:alpha-beta hydrolase superfamily lysophospholipase